MFRQPKSPRFLNAGAATLDVDGQILHINPLSDPSDGDSFQVFVADTVNGTPTITTEGWTYDSTTGSVVFGALVGCNPNSLGDLDGNGTVEFADFLVLSANFGSAVGGAESVPEPTSFALLSMAGLLGGLMRRRRQN